MKYNVTDRSHLQLFTNDGKKLSLTSGREEFLRTYHQLGEGQYIVAFFGYLQLGEVSFEEGVRWLRIGKHSLSKFTDVKVLHKSFVFLFEVAEFLEVYGATLEQFLKMGRLDVESHVGLKENVKMWPGYEMTEVKTVVAFHHPEHPLKEMLEMYNDEERVIFWKLKDKPE